MYLPIYYTIENEQILEVLRTVKNDYELSISDSTAVGILNQMGVYQNHLHFQISLSEPKKIEKLNLENYYGMLEGTKKGSTNPVIAIVTHYDTFSMVPVDL